MGWESSGVVGFDLGPLLEGQMRTAKLKSAYNLLIIGPRGFGALSLRWIQFASVFRCARSSFICIHLYISYYCSIGNNPTNSSSSRSQHDAFKVRAKSFEYSYSYVVVTN